MDFIYKTGAVVYFMKAKKNLLSISIRMPCPGCLFQKSQEYNEIGK